VPSEQRGPAHTLTFSAIEPSLVGQFTQTVGVSLLAILSYLVNRSIGRTSLRYWTGAWASLSAGLAAMSQKKQERNAGALAS
jgi:hypothetical protein